MVSKRKRRSFSRTFKLLVIKRMERGESGAALARELTIKREVLYRWRDAVRAGGEEALRDGPGRPTRVEAAAMATSRGSAAKAGDLAAARRQIAELERKVGQQQQDLDFLEQALLHIEGLRQPSDGSGVTVSSPRSRR
jgi:transposase-like protein